MTSKELNLKLKYAFPEIEKTYDEETSWQDGDNTGSHIVYGDIFIPFIKQQYKLNNGKKLEQIFNFIENLLLLNDEYANEVISFSLIESLMFDEDIQFNLITQHMGIKTLKIVEEFKLY